MSVPPENEIQIAVLKIIAELGGEARPLDVYPRVTALFPQLMPDDLSRAVKTGGNAWTIRIQFVRQHLVQAGELYKEPYGIWRITDKGRQRIGAIPQGHQEQPYREPEQQSRADVPPVSPPLPHGELVERVAEIGRLLGRSVGVEEGPVYKHDVVWKDNPWAAPSVVLEICDKGNLDKDLASLTWAVRNWKAKGILVVVSEGDFVSASRKLGSEDNICLVKADSLLQVYSLVKGDSLAAIRAIFSS